MADGPPPNKRRRMRVASEPSAAVKADAVSSKGLNRPISPPASKHRKQLTVSDFLKQGNVDDLVQETFSSGERQTSESPTVRSSSNEQTTENLKRYVASPIQLTRVKDLSPAENEDCVGLSDILGDPMIKECWNFNYLFDLDYVMEHFDPDVRDKVNVKIVHGFWKKDDERRINLMEVVEHYPNVEAISAYIPDPFGTHHTKMLILLRHDDLAQVIIHTANMISRDWGNMTQAVWKSPLLPLISPVSQLTPSGPQHDGGNHPIGGGERFKIDLMRYINAYGFRVNQLATNLIKYNFSSIRAAFIGSVPSRQKLNEVNPAKQTSWGWLGLQEILSKLTGSGPQTSDSPPHIVMQVSSIATLGQTPAWLTHFQSVLAESSMGTVSQPKPSSPSVTNFFSKRSLASGAPVSSTSHTNTKFSIIFPTANEIRTCLDGYVAGASIHMKIQSKAQQKQLEYLRPLLCHWRHPEIHNRKETIWDVLTAGISREPTPVSDSSAVAVRHRAHRGPAAPHIKTYIRFSSQSQYSIDWAMMTSANLSKQAWGDMVNKSNEIWIQSWEAGVVVWPEIFGPGGLQGEEEATIGEREQTKSRKSRAIMVPVFDKDMPRFGEDMKEAESEQMREAQTIVGFRMPYDLPLAPYKATEDPWCATLPDSEMDWKGMVWRGY